MRTVEIIHFRDTGRKLVKVPIYKKGIEAILYEDDFDLLMSLGVSPFWTIIPGLMPIVLVHLPTLKARAGVARVIMDAGKDQKVCYINNIPLDLRRDNLVIIPGRGLYRTRDFLTPGVTHLHRMTHLHEPIRNNGTQ